MQRQSIKTYHKKQPSGGGLGSKMARKGPQHTSMQLFPQPTQTPVEIPSSS